MALAFLVLSVAEGLLTQTAWTPPAPAAHGDERWSVSGAERWELAVEVARSGPVAEPPLAVAIPEAPTVRVRIYDDAGTLVHSTEVAPSLAYPDWTADLDGDDPEADWSYDWDALDPGFFTVELYTVEAGGDDLLARYVYAPTNAIAYAAGGTDFYRPSDATDEHAAVAFEVCVAAPAVGQAPAEVAVSARTRHTSTAFEEVFADTYVIPYNHDRYAALCALNCPDALPVPGYFLARLPAGAARPTAQAQRYTFAGESDVVLPYAWGPVTWDVPGLTLAFPEGRRLKVGGTLVAEGARLTAADAEVGWRGVLYYDLLPEAVHPSPNVLRGSVVEGVRRVPSEGLVVRHGAVTVYGAYGRALVVEDESEIRGGAGNVTGLLVSGAWADVTVTGESRIHDNDGGGILAAGGAHVTVTGSSRIELNGGTGVTASGYGTLVDLVGASVLDNGGVGVRALAQGEVRFANATGAPFTTVEDNAGGLDTGSGGSLDAGQCTSPEAPCDGRTAHLILRNADGGHFDARALDGSTLYAQGNQWHTPDITQLVLVDDLSSVLVVCPIIGGGACALDGRLGGGSRKGGTRGVAAEGGEPLRIEDVLALVDEAERARLAGDESAFDLAATAAVAAMDTSRAEDERRAAFEVTARLFAWAQPAAPLAALEALAAAAGEGRPWALRALGVARAAGEDYADARALADTLVTRYAGSEHAAFGLSLAVRVAVVEGDEAAAVAALVALAAAYPEPDEVGPLAALVAGAFPRADLSGLRLGGGPEAPGAQASATASGVPGAVLAVEAVRPNPASGAASVPFALGAEARVEAVLYDVLGRRVAVLASGPFAAGRHVLVLDGARLPSGTYVVYVTAHTAGGVERAVERFTLTRRGEP